MKEARKTILSSFLLIVDTLGRRLIGLLSTLILARVLLPEDFGLVAIAMIYMGLMETISLTGSEDYILRHSAPEPAVVDSAWTLNFCLKSLTTILALVFSPAVSYYYNDESLLPVLIVISFYPAVSAIANPGLWLMTRDQNLKPIVKASLVSKLIAVTGTVSIALAYHSYWALVLGHFFAVGSWIIASYVISDYRPKFTTSRIREQASFSVWMLPQAVFGYVKTQLDSFLVSLFYGKAQLGSYHTMKYITNMPISEILNPITKPLLIELGKVQNLPEEFKKQYSLTFFVSFLAVGPIIYYLFVQSELCTLFLLGSNWVNFHDIFGNIALLGFAAMLRSQGFRVLLVYGKTKSMFIFDALSFFIIYGILFNLGDFSILHFVQSRVALEAVLCIFLYIAVTSHWAGTNELFRSFLLVLPLGVSMYVAGSISYWSIDYFSEKHYLIKFFVAGISYVMSIAVLYSALFYLLYRQTYEGRKILLLLSPYLKVGPK